MEIKDYSIQIFEYMDKVYSLYCVKKWIYKDSILVVDFYYSGVKFALDIYIENNKICLDVVSRDAKNLIFSLNKKRVLNEASYSSLTKDLPKTIKNVFSFIDKKYDFKISLIIPVYKREDLIKTCVDSINKQTLNKKLFEVIFVDDFSPDKSILTIEKLINKSINYKILRRPINSGSASAPRNDGILAAKGKYIYFLDSDDYLFPYALKNMLESAEKSNSDLVYVKYDGDKGRSWGKRPFTKGNVSNANIVENHLVRSLMCSKLVLNNILKKNDIFFPIDVRIGEDRIYMMNVLSHVKKICILGDMPYYYITNHDGDKLTILPSNLKHDFEVVSRGFKFIYFSNMHINDKINFFSSWMNVVLEAYILGKLKSVRHPLESKRKYFENIYREFYLYKDLHSKKSIYEEFYDIYEFFINNDFESCCKLAIK